MTDELEGKIAIVTGAAQGMGRAVAKKFVYEGAVVIPVDLREDKLKALAGELDDNKTEIYKPGAGTMIQICDISAEAQVWTMVNTVMERYGRIDILVNCAGIMYPTVFHNMKVEEWDRVMAVNLRGTFLTMKEVYPHMMKQGGGCMVNFSSTAGRTVSTLGGAHYTASKHGVIGLTRAVAEEGGPYGIRVNAVCPGLIDTEMVRDTVNEEAVKEFEKSFPIRRLGTPEEVAELVLFLVSDRAKYITGAAVNISGGDLLA
jgi:NAD(P)-dependent dehydrogenase (short-subunit alcohol dehydrogenase family)